MEISPQYVSAEHSNSLLARYAPIFILEDPAKSYNKIGTPAVREDKNGQPDVYVDSHKPTIYAMEQKFKDNGGDYTNLIYRVHFEKTPYKHLTAGRNLGLFFIVTLNQKNQPLLVTTVHTCGCYLAIIPTSYLPKESYPENWPLGGQDVFGEYLPSFIDMKESVDAQHKFVFSIRGGTHRVMHLDLSTESDITSPADFVTAALEPMTSLRELPFGDSKISFFETEGARKGYVRNSHKPYERLFMSWWAMDWRVGEDKDVGPREETGTTFYTSLKFWAWKKSDLWDFAEFLKYWGWKL
ncbi:MAG: hypothetical protein QNK24_16495 [Desulfuromusa sp.]|nr:hypothetical protein [Desulfuromusa sp.]